MRTSLPLSKLVLSLSVAVLGCGPGPDPIVGLPSTPDAAVASVDGGLLLGTGGAGGAGSSADGGHGGAGGSGGGGGGGVNPVVDAGQGGGVVSGIGFVNPMLTVGDSTSAVAIDAKGGVHLVTQEKAPLNGYFDELEAGIFYGFCPSDCSKGVNWKTVKLGSGFDPHLTLAPDGTVHVLYENWSNQSPYGVKYAVCASGCTQPSGWQSATIWSGSTASTEGERAIRWSPAGLRIAFFGNGNLNYGTCASNCAAPTSWTFSVASQLYYAGRYSLAVTAAGAPRIATTQGYPVQALKVFSCDSGCGAPAGWTMVELFYSDEAHVSLQLDAQDRPRLVFNQGYIGDPVASSDFVSYFAGCDANCQDATNWTGISLGPALTGFSGLDLVMTGGKPRLALASKQGPLLLLCVADCATTAPLFVSTPIETPAELQAKVAVPTPMGCTNHKWETGEGATLAVSEDGKHLTVLWDASGWSRCNQTYVESTRVLRVYDFVSQ